MVMYIDTVPNRNSRPCILLRESYREGGKVRKNTLANLTKWPPELVQGLRTLLGGGKAIEKFEESFTVVRSRPHGHVAAVLGTLRRLRLERVISAKACRERNLVVAMIVARIIDPRSKLAMARGLGEETLLNSLGEVLGLESADEDDLYGAMDWLLERQARIETKLAKRHLAQETLVLYDVSSTYFEGCKCPLAQMGHSLDGKKGNLQIIFGLLCDIEGCPVAVEVFDGHTGDPSTLASQIKSVRERFGLLRVVLVGDRGMITEARIREELKGSDGLDWISALRAPQIRKLLSAGSLQFSLFDEKDLAEITDPAYPGERLVACRNPFLAHQRAQKREELLAATERELEKISEATQRKKRRLKGKEKIGMRVGKVLGRFKVAKHFRITISDESFHYQRNAEKIAAEAALDGIYIIRTSVAHKTLSADEAVRAYKSLSTVERAFRSYKSVDLKVRPIYHWLAERVRAHVFLCMLAYYVEWHMREALAPILFDDHDKSSAQKLRPSVVAPVQPSVSAKRKARKKRTEDDMPVHSFQTMLSDLATIVKNRVHPKLPEALPFDQITILTPLQKRAFKLLGLSI